MIRMFLLVFFPLVFVDTAVITRKTAEVLSSLFILLSKKKKQL